MRASYRDWLEHQGYAPNTVQAQLHRAGRVEDCYGDLDKHYDKNRLEGVISELRYSAEDARRSKPNPTKIPFEGDVRSNLASYRNAVERYCKFRREAGDDDNPSVYEGSSADGRVLGEEGRGQLIGLERDMQKALRQAVEQLEPGLVIIDDGAKRSVPSGFVDITARDSSGAIVVIELKTGTAGQKAVAQVLSYAGDILEEEPDSTVRAILVAGDFDKKARAAARMVPNLSLREYRVRFEFLEVGRSDSVPAPKVRPDDC